MSKKFFKSKLFRVIIIIAVCGLLIFFNPINIFNPLRNAAWTALSPFQKIAYLLSLKIGNAGEFIFSIGQFKKENEKLLMENQKLLAENAKLAGIKKQNEIFKEQLNLLPREKFDLETAYVIGQDPDGFGSWLEISKGSDEGIEDGMPVIVSGGILIGKIDEIQKNSSRVILTTNPQSKINSMTSESGTKGIVRGEYGLGIIFDMISQTDPISAGDKVITSGMSNNVPRGLFIGIVQDVKLSPDRLFQQAAVIFPIQFSKLEIVSVIKSVK